VHQLAALGALWNPWRSEDDSTCLSTTPNTELREPTLDKPRRPFGCNLYLLPTITLKPASTHTRFASVDKLQKRFQTRSF